jgi:ubiquinone biosynthesis O-methyltransferase
VTNSKAVPESASYKYVDAQLNESHAYLLPILLEGLRANSLSPTSRVFDLGCGNGAVSNAVAQQGFQVVGVDGSTEGIQFARSRYPEITFEQASVYDDLNARFGNFDVVVSLEVIEHLYSPRAFLKTAYDLLAPSGLLFLSTPFHGYWKNLVIAATGKSDLHFNPLADHGHIKFWSLGTLTRVLNEAGFVVKRVQYAGRVRPLSKSMFIIASKA